MVIRDVWKTNNGFMVIRDVWKTIMGSYSVLKEQNCPKI